MPVVAIDWPKVLSRLPGDTALFALTYRQAAILLSVSEQLTWEATWRTNGYDFSDYDTLQSEVADLQAQLAMPVNLQQLIEHVDEIEDLLRLLSSQDTCCQGHDWTDGDGYTIPIDEDSTNGVPQHFVDSGWATDTDDWAGFEEYMCHVAHVLVNNMGHKVVQLLDVFDNAGTLVIGVGALAGLIALLMGSAATLLVAGILLAAGSATRLWDKLLEGGADVIPDFAEVEAARDVLVCGWMDAANDGLDDRIAGLHAAIDSEFSLLEAEILKALMPAEWIKAIYTGRWSDGTETIDISQRMVDAGIGPGTYVCDCPDEVGEYQVSYSFDTTQDGWTKSGTGAAYHPATGNPAGAPANYKSGGTTGSWRLSIGKLRADVGLASVAGDWVDIHKITFDIYHAVTGQTMTVTFQHAGTDTVRTFVNNIAWTNEEQVWAPPKRWVDGTDGFIWLSTVTAGNGQWCYFDNVWIDFDANESGT